MFVIFQFSIFNFFRQLIIRKVRLEMIVSKINKLAFSEDDKIIITTEDGKFSINNISDVDNSHIDNVTKCETFNSPDQLKGKIVELVAESSNIFAYYNTSKDDDKKMIFIYDKTEKKRKGYINMKKLVKNIIVNSDRIVVVTNKKIYCYSFNNLSLIKGIETVENVDGICVLSKNDLLLSPAAAPAPSITGGEGKGLIRVSDLSTSTSSNEEKKKEKDDIIIQAHKENISALAIHPSNTRVASTSKNGTIIRIFNISHHLEKEKIGDRKVCEFRRGKNSAVISSLCFNSKGNLLLCSSDKGTIHIFSFSEEKNNNDSSSEKKEEEKNTTSYLSFAGLVLPSYFSSSWSFYQIHLPHLATVSHICKFSSNVYNLGKVEVEEEKEKVEKKVEEKEKNDGELIYVACKDGKFYTIYFNYCNGTEKNKIKIQNLLL